MAPDINAPSSPENNGGLEETETGTTTREISLTVTDCILATSRNPEDVQVNFIFQYKDSPKELKETEQMKLNVSKFVGVQKALIDVFQNNPELMCNWVQGEIALNGNREIIKNFLYIFKNKPNCLYSYAINEINSRFCNPKSKEFDEEILNMVGTSYIPNQ